MLEKVLYGKICYLGGQWSVTYEPSRRDDGRVSGSGYLTGYGNFPFDRFPDIPVIDLEGNDVAWEVFCGGCPEDPGYGNTHLSDYLDYYRSKGVRILYGGKSES